MLLALQPLAILPFNLDYEFEYNHMQRQASAEREKQQLLEQHAAKVPYSMGEQPAMQSPAEGARASVGRFSSLLGRGGRRNKDFTRSNSWTSSLSTSLGFGKTFAGNNSSSSESGSQSRSSGQSDRLLRTEDDTTPTAANTTQDRLVNSAECTPTNSSQSWSMDWIRSFVAANDQSQQQGEAVDSSAGTASAQQQTANDTNTSWSRLGARLVLMFL